MATGINLATQNVIPAEGSAMMVRNFQAVGLQSDDITGGCTVYLDFGVKDIWGEARENGTAISLSLTTGMLSTGVTIAWEAPTEMYWRLRVGDGATGTLAYKILYP